MTSPDDDVITEFRANSGSVNQAMSGALAHVEIAILPHLGRRSGKAYTTPVAYMPYGDATTEATTR